jgi:hypothetical protein
MIEEKVIYKILDEFEAKHKITEIILLGKDGGIRRINIGEEDDRT